MTLTLVKTGFVKRRLHFVGIKDSNHENLGKQKRFQFHSLTCANQLLLSMTLNVLVVSVIGRFSVRRQHTSVYNILFVNLAVTNALTSILLWFANNLLFFFNDAMMSLLYRNYCAFMVCLAGALFISLAFGLECSSFVVNM